MAMVPFDYQRFVTTVVGLVEGGRIPLARVDDAVVRILGAKAQLGLLDGTSPPDVPLEVIGCAEHRHLARTAVQKSAVVLTGADVLPIPVDATVLAAGVALDDVGIGCGGWTISWTGAAGPVTAGRTIVDGLREVLGGDRLRYDASGRFGGTYAPFGVVSVHELPYVEGGGDRADLTVPAEQIDVVRRMRDHVDRLVLVVISGRPLLIENVVGLVDAVVACWLPGSEADGIADVVLGRVPFTGRLAVRWPRDETQIARANDDGEPVSVPPVWPVGHRAIAASGTAPAGRRRPESSTSRTNP